MKHIPVFLLVVVLSVAFGHQFCHATTPPALHEGYWVVMFAVSPDCPACETAISWLGHGITIDPKINCVILCPWLTEDLELSAGAAQVGIFVDDGGQLGASLDVEQAPTAIFFLDREELGRLDWPFTEDELIQEIERLSVVPRTGPWEHLGEEYSSAGLISMLRGRMIDLSDIPYPWMLSFYRPLCQACQNGIAALTQLAEEIGVIVAVTDPDSMSADDRALLINPKIKVVLDETGELQRRYDVRAAPTHLLVDEDGQICWIQEGILRLEQLHDLLHLALGDDEIIQGN